MSQSATSNTVVLTEEGFEDTHLGDEPYPFIAETWCVQSFIGASTDVAHSGSQSLKYNHSCAPGTQATLTTLSFSQCTHFPLDARVVFNRLHEFPGSSFFSLNSYSSKEPRTALILTEAGDIYVSDGVGPDLPVTQFNFGEWTKIEAMFDFVGGTFDLHVNDLPIGTFPTYVSQAFWFGFGTGQPGVTFYDDDVAATLDVRGERAGCTGIEPLPWPWPPEEGQQGG